MNPFKAIVGVVVSLVVIAALAVGGWQLGWWAQTSAVNHQAHIFANSYGTQSADIAEARNLATQITQVAVQINDPATPTSEVSALKDGLFVQMYYKGVGAGEQFYDQVGVEGTNFAIIVQKPPQRKNDLHL